MVPFAAEAEVERSLEATRADNACMWEEISQRLVSDPDGRGTRSRGEFDRARAQLRANPGLVISSEDFSDDDLRCDLNSDGGSMWYCRRCDGISYPNRPCVCCGL